MYDRILMYLKDNYRDFDTVDLNPILKPIEEKKGWNFTKQFLLNMQLKDVLEYRDVNKYEPDGHGGMKCIETNWGAMITQAGLDYLEEKRREERQDEIISKQAKYSNRSNIWSPVFAGLAALAAILTFVLQLQDKPQSKKIEQLQKQATTLDSMQKIHQTQIDALGSAKKEDGKIADSTKPK